MRHKGAFALAATAIMGGAALLAAPAGAQEPLPLDVSPTSGSVGSNVTVSGQGCIEGERPGLITVVLFGESDERLFTVDDVSDDGSWSTVITLPEGLTPGPYSLTAVCAVSTGGEVQYEGVDFEVVATAPPPTSTTTTVVTPAPEPAAPATPVPGEPIFTG
jgi:hypothetical protein